MPVNLYPFPPILVASLSMGVVAIAQNGLIVADPWHPPCTMSGFVSSLIPPAVLIMRIWFSLALRAHRMICSGSPTL